MARLAHRTEIRRHLGRQRRTHQERRAPLSRDAAQGSPRRRHRVGDVRRDQPPAQARQADLGHPRRARARRHRRDRRAGDRRPAGARHPRGGRQGRLAPRSPGSHPHGQRVLARPHPGHRRARHRRRAGRRQDRGHRRLPGRRRGRQHHDARARRLGHDGRRDRGGAEGRRVRDLHRRRRRLHRRSERGQQRAQDRSHQLRGDARARVAGRQGAADPVGRIRHEVRRADPRPIELQRQRRDMGRA